MAQKRVDPRDQLFIEALRRSSTTSTHLTKHLTQVAHLTNPSPWSRTPSIPETLMGYVGSNLRLHLPPVSCYFCLPMIREGGSGL